MRQREGANAPLPPKTPLSGEHGSQGTARQDVDVQVRHLLSRIRPDIGKQAIAGFDRARFARDMADRADETGDLRLAGTRCEIVP